MNKEIDDSILVDAFKKGDRASYCELVTRYTEKVYHLAMRITRNDEDAEEVLQDVFITIFHKIHTFEGKSAFSSWLYRITANTSFMKLRQRKKHSAASLEELGFSSKDDGWMASRSDTCDTDYISSRHELRQVLEQAISRLPEEYKVIFVLRDVDGLSNQEVGEILHLSVPAVKSRLHRSRLMLRRKLQRYYDDYTSEERIFYGMNPFARSGYYQQAA